MSENIKAIIINSKILELLKMVTDEKDISVLKEMKSKYEIIDIDTGYYESITKICEKCGSIKPRSEFRQWENPIAHSGKSIDGVCLDCYWENMAHEKLVLKSHKLYKEIYGYTELEKLKQKVEAHLDDNKIHEDSYAASEFIKKESKGKYKSYDELEWADDPQNNEKYALISSAISEDSIKLKSILLKVNSKLQKHINQKSKL